MKVIQTFWFTAATQILPRGGDLRSMLDALANPSEYCIGIVVGEDENTRELKAYIGIGEGQNERIDTNRILAWGAKLSVSRLIEICAVWSGGVKYQGWDLPNPYNKAPDAEAPDAEAQQIRLAKRDTWEECKTKIALIAVLKGLIEVRSQSEIRNPAGPQLPVGTRISGVIGVNVQVPGVPNPNRWKKGLS